MKPRKNIWTCHAGDDYWNSKRTGREISKSELKERPGVEIKILPL